MFKWLLGKHIKKEVKSHLGDLHLHLANSFSNIKEDISKIHLHLQNRDEKIRELENKIHRLEGRLFYALQPREKPMQVEEAEDEEKELEPQTHQRSDLTDLELATLTYTQKQVLRNLYELNIDLKKDLVTIKSLVKFIHPNRNYESVRTTVTEYLKVLYEYDLVRKDRMGRQVIINLTEKGKQLAREVIKAEKQRKKTKKKQKIKEENDI